MMGQASVISTFTDQEIAPLVAEQQKLRFSPQGIPFFVAQTNFRALQEQFPDYSYRTPALNPTNPEDRPTDWQADIIEVFARNTQLKEFVSESTCRPPVMRCTSASSTRRIERTVSSTRWVASLRSCS